MSFTQKKALLSLKLTVEMISAMLLAIAPLMHLLRVTALVQALEVHSADLTEVLVRQKERLLRELLSRSHRPIS